MGVNQIPSEMGTMIIPTLQLRKLRCGEMDNFPRIPWV